MSEQNEKTQRLFVACELPDDVKSSLAQLLQELRASSDGSVRWIWEVPGMAAADLVARQVWWLVTVVATAGGLALIFFAGPIGLKAAGLALMAAPHVVGAPSHTIEDGGILAELAAQFAVTTLLVTGLFWLLLGSLTGYFYRRFGET
mgnify:CR=1 FL=1